MFRFFKQRFRLLTKTPVCQACSAFIPQTPEGFCNVCLQNLNLRQWTPLHKGVELYAAAILTPLLKRWIYGHKFYAKTDYADRLAGLLQLALAHTPPGIGPTGQTGFTLLPPHYGASPHFLPIALRLSKQLNLPLADGLLCWQRDILPQHQLRHRSERMHNMAHALKADLSVLNRYGHINQWIVLDDLTTSGASLKEALRAINTVPSKTVNSLTAIGLAIAHVPHL